MSLPTSGEGQDGSSEAVTASDVISSTSTSETAQPVRASATANSETEIVETSATLGADQGKSSGAAVASTICNHGNHVMASSGTNATSVSTTAAEVQWLEDNYELAEGVSIPRSTVYFHYLRYCSIRKLDAVNAASFGKIIRSVFLGLKTRRLGARGNSKYHYYGIREKQGSYLRRLLNDPNALLHQELPQQKRQKHQTPAIAKENSGLAFSPTRPIPASVVGATGPSCSESQRVVATAQATTQPEDHFQQYLQLQHPMPILPHLAVTSADLPVGVTIENVLDFSELYKEHCEEFLNVIRSLQFSLIDPLWKNFWSRSARSEKDAECEESNSTSQGDSPADGDDHQQLSWNVFRTLCEMEPVQSYARECDCLVYQALADILIPNVLRPIPSFLTQAMRTLAKHLEIGLAFSLTDIPSAMANIKMKAARALAQILEHYTSLSVYAQPKSVEDETAWDNSSMTVESGGGAVDDSSSCSAIDEARVDNNGIVAECDEVHVDNKSAVDLEGQMNDPAVAEAARAALGKPDRIKEAQDVLSKVDFDSVRELGRWSFTSREEETDLSSLEECFKEALVQQQTLETWATCLEKTVDEVLKERKQRGVESGRAASQLLLQWTLHCAITARDPALREVASVGAFRMLRLFYKEYMTFLLENCIHAAAGQSPVARYARFVILKRSYGAQEKASATGSVSSSDEGARQIKQSRLTALLGQSS